MAPIVAKTDLPSAVQSEELVQAWLDAANALAARVAPCLVSTDPAPSVGQLAEAKLVLIGMIVRWKDAGAGALASQTAGPFGQTLDTRVKTGYNPWPSEVERLQAICASGAGRAFEINTIPDMNAFWREWDSSTTWHPGAW